MQALLSKNLPLMESGTRTFTRKPPPRAQARPRASKTALGRKLCVSKLSQSGLVDRT